MTRSEAIRYRTVIEQAAQSLPDKEALSAVTLYPRWEAGTEYTEAAGRPVGYRVCLGDRLYKLRQEHTSQIGWEPEQAASLWEQVCESHTGAADDPIPYEGNMALVAGLYYSQDNRLYRCIRDTGNPVYHRLEELVGLYVEEVS